MIERRPDQTPVRVVEAEWENDRVRYVSALGAMKLGVQVGFFASYVNFLGFLERGQWREALLVGTPLAFANVWPAFRRVRAYRYVRAQYRPIDASRPGEVGLVQISLCANDRPFGADVGFLTVDEHAITFEGGQVSFSLTPSRWSTTSSGVLSSPDWPGRTLVVKPIPRRRALRDLHLPDTEALQAAFRRIEPSSDAVEIAQVPPRRASPNSHVRGSVWALTASAVVAGVAAAGLCGFALSWSPLAFFVAYAIATGLGVSAALLGMAAVVAWGRDAALKALEQDP